MANIKTLRKRGIHTNINTPGWIEDFIGKGHPAKKPRPSRSSKIVAFRADVRLTPDSKPTEMIGIGHTIGQAKAFMTFGGKIIPGAKVYGYIEKGDFMRFEQRGNAKIAESRTSKELEKKLRRT